MVYLVGTIAAALGLAVSMPLVSALPAESYAVHETRADLPIKRNWKPGERIDGDAVIPLRIALTQSNLHEAHERVMDISHPLSPNFGRYLTADEVYDLFAPTDGTETAVRQWLVSEGIPESAIMAYENRGWLAIDLPVREAERLFLTEYYELSSYPNAGMKETIKIGCNSYSVPKHLQGHIDFIMPGVKPSPSLTRREVELQKRSRPWTNGGCGPKRYHGPGWPWYKNPPGSGGLPPQLQGCGLNFTMACYQALYNIPAHNAAQSGNEVGLYETYYTYSQENIDSFFAKYASYVPQGTHPRVDSVDGGVASGTADSPYNGGEPDLDLEIIFSLIWPQNITIFQVDTVSEANYAGFLNTFLDALDGSYCSYTAYGITGDSPGIDPPFPDTAPGGYDAPLMCGTYKPTRVIVVDYSESESDFPVAYLKRECNEFAKLSLQGTTFFFASGDYGVSGTPGDPTASGCLGTDQTVYNPICALCPYVTVVGATQLQTNQTILDPESAMDAQVQLLTDTYLNISSGGGFFNYFAAPSYQQAALATYFAHYDPGLPYYVANANATNVGANGGVYNRGGRGFPDVSANGFQFRAFIADNVSDDDDAYVLGTSLSADVWASIATLINQERQLKGKGPIGFINPVLYENAHVLTDIKNGSNPGCGSAGFKAVPGWDPITGLGTPNYPALLSLYLSLP